MASSGTLSGITTEKPHFVQCVTVVLSAMSSSPLSGIFHTSILIAHGQRYPKLGGHNGRGTRRSFQRLRDLLHARLGFRHRFHLSNIIFCPRTTNNYLGFYLCHFTPQSLFIGWLVSLQATMRLVCAVYGASVPVLRSWEIAVTSCAGANGFWSMMLFGTPFDDQSPPLAPLM